MYYSELYIYIYIFLKILFMVKNFMIVIKRPYLLTMMKIKTEV